MKSISFLVWLLLACLTARATDFTQGAAFCTFNYATALVAPNTNTVSATNAIEGSLYHTFYFNCTSNLNGAVIWTDFSGDSTNWIVYGSNTMAATASAAINISTNTVSKQSFVRFRLIGTNYTGTLTYLGGR